LSEVGVEVAPAGNARELALDDGTTGLAFPIVAGTAATDPVELDLLHEGGLVLSGEGTNVLLANFVVNTNGLVLESAQTSISSGGEVGPLARDELFALNVDGAAVNLPSSGDEETGLPIVDVTGIQLTLSVVVAASLNTALGTSFPEGAEVGSAAIRLAFGEPGEEPEAPPPPPPGIGPENPPAEETPPEGQ
jgi:hypothetical protein